MRRALAGTWLALWLALLAGQAGAQGTPVRSGEHAAFTRLVFPARGGLTWTPTRDGNRVTLAFDDPTLAFDIGRVFDFVPRTRLAALEVGPGALSLDLACDCDVSVEQIPSGHVVIDIAAAAPGARGSERPAVALPLRLDPLDSFGLPAAALTPDVASPLPPPPTDSATRALPSRSAQISIRTMGRTPLLPSQVVPKATEAPRDACAEETLAADLLRRDPVEALEELPALRAALIDDADRPVAAAHDALARAYLAAGWGAEAAKVLLTGPEPPDAALLSVATALDAIPGLGAPRGGPIAACGPASAVLALLAGISAEAWTNVDEAAFARFVDTLPRATRRDLLPRLGPALRRLGRGDLLFIEPPAREDVPPPLPVASGTDLDAVEATRAALSEGTAPPETLADGLALRGSVPEGPMRDDLDRVLTHALVRAGYLTEAEAVIGTSADLAASALDVALRELPAEQAIVVAMRLRPVLPPGGPQARRAGDALQVFGLTPLMRSFGAPEPPPDPAPTPFGTPEEQAWIERDFAALDPESGRGRLAELRRRRNAPATPSDDFTRAADALASSTELSAVLQTLVDAPD